ncbi:MAG: HAD hydrolase family protein [Bacteroidota bacterium]
MIELFVSDIDGCLAEPFQAYDLMTLHTLATYVQDAVGEEGPRPLPFTLCSGRPMPYVEAMTQLLGVRHPALFESGGGMYDPMTSHVTWHPSFTDELASSRGRLERWVREELVPGTQLSMEHTKRTQIGIIGPHPDEIQAVLRPLTEHVEEHHPAFAVYHTPISIDVTARALTKAQGFRWLADTLRVPLDRMAYIGDTNGDLEALLQVGHGFAPANAAPEVHAAVAHPLTAHVTDAVLEAYRWCTAYNAQSHSPADS